MDENLLIHSLDRIIKRFIFQSRKFIEYTAFPYGINDLIQYNIKSEKLTYDYEYFVFTKCTKTLISIKELLKMGQNEDVFILIRSIFENYLSCRYLNENQEKIDEFITNPLALALAYYNLNQDGKIINREKEIVGDLENPKNFKLGLDKKYYYVFYDFLSRFSHCNFGVIDCYVDEHIYFTINKVNYPIIIRLFTVFVFTKIFEHVVTVEGEDFLNKKTEKDCYDLVQYSICLQNEAFDYLIEFYKNKPKNELDKYKNNRMKDMLKDMKKSLIEELGSIKK